LGGRVCWIGQQAQRTKGGGLLLWTQGVIQGAEEAVQGIFGCEIENQICVFQRKLLRFFD
jgi:hypothetical protein